MRQSVTALLTLLFSVALHCETFKRSTPQGGPFAIETTDGFLSSDQLIGKHVLLTFGFTHCPDVCPLTLRRLKQLSEKLTPKERANFRFLFISVDNERDSIKKLKGLKKIYGSSFIGATDSDENLKKIAESFGARYRRFRTKRGHLIVDHTDSIFHIDQQGKWIATIPHGSSVEEMLGILRIKKQNSANPAPSRNIKMLAQNTSCDLGSSLCMIKYNGKPYTLELSPRPISIEKKFNIRFTLPEKNLVAREIDFEGIDLNMGYIRPKFTLKAGLYTADLSLPICELSSMRWVVRVILELPNGELGFMKYQLTSTD